MNVELPKRAMTVEECAVIGGVSRDTIWRQIREGKLVATKFGPKSVRILPEDWERFINRQRSGAA